MTEKEDSLQIVRHEYDRKENRVQTMKHIHDRKQKTTMRHKMTEKREVTNDEGMDITNKEDSIQIMRH